LEGQGTTKALEFVTNCFDGEAVVAKEVGGWKAGMEEKVGGLSKRAEQGDGMVCFRLAILTLCRVALLRPRFTERLILFWSFNCGASV